MYLNNFKCNTHDEFNTWVCLPGPLKNQFWQFAKVIGQILGFINKYKGIKLIVAILNIM